MASWGATKAKAQFSEVLNRAVSEGPQLVTRRNQEFYVMTREQMETRKSVKTEVKPFVSAWDAMQPSFEERYDVEFPRVRGKARHVDLG